MKTTAKKLMSLAAAFTLLLEVLPLGINAVPSAAAATNSISNASLSAKVGDLGQIEELYIQNNPTNKSGKPINFVLPNNTSPQNDVQHQWMGEMLFSYRIGDSNQFPADRTGFVEVDTNKTLAAGGSTKFTNINPDNQYFTKEASSDGKKVEVNFIGQNLDSTTARAMKGFDVKSVFDMDTDDGSMLWEITLKNKSSKYMEFGDIGLPMPWNNKYQSVSDTYDNRVTVHNFAGADSGYSYAIRTSGEGNFMMFAPVPESGARIEYVDYWLGDTGELRNGSLYSNWVGDSGGWFPGLNVLYIHSKDIQKTGRGYFTDATSLVLGPDEQKTYKFKFSAVRAGDNDPQENAQSPNNASTSMEDRESNLRSILYKSGMIDAVALPGFQAAINMPVKLDLHYDDSLIDVESIDIQSVDENDPFDAAHIPEIKAGQTRDKMVNNTRAGRGLPDGNPGYDESVQFVETKLVNGEQHHIYSLKFGNIGNNSVRVNYKLKSGAEQLDKFTQFEFNILAELDQTSQAHSEFMVDKTQDKDPDSPTYGIYRDWYLTTGLDTTTSHWGDDWSHDNINFMTMKNYLDPDPNEIRSIENYLIDFMWEKYMKDTQNSFTVANYLKDSGAYTNSEKPYVRTFSEMMESTGYFNMYRIQKAYPNLLEYRETPQYYLEKAYGIYYNRVSSGSTGFYGEQQIPDMIEALKEEGMLTEYENLKKKFAQTKGRNVTNAAYPYGSEFEYDNTGEEGAYSAAKALRTYYPEDARAAAALKSMGMADLKTRAMRGIQPTWYFNSVPVFRAGEGWWNFQYTASLAGSIMDDWLRYEDDGRTGEQAAIAQQRNYAAKISNFNAVNMGQISAQSVGGISWRYNAQKGGTGTKNVNDGGTRVMNNGWQDFSGESEEGLYGSLLRISSDIVTDPVFGLFGYGASVTDEDGTYQITPKDGFGKRINLIDEKIYLVSESDKIESAQIQKDGKAFRLQLSNLAQSEHASKITFDGAGVENGYYTMKLDDQDAGQFYVKNNKGTAMFQMSGATTAELTIEKADTGENQAPEVTAELTTQNPQAMIPFVMNGIVTDDGAPDGTLTYQWEAVSTPEGGKLTFTNPKSTTTRANGTKEGSYTVRLTANDGQMSGSNELTFELAAPPEKQPPVIGEVTAVQDASNSSILVLSGTATPDPVYSAVTEPVWTYGWTVKQKPEGAADVTFVGGDKANAYARISKAGTYVFTFTAADEGKMSSKDVTINIAKDADGSYKAISVVTQINTAPTLPGQMDVLFEDGYKQSAIVWDEVAPASYAAAGEFVVEGHIADSELKVLVTVYVVKAQPQNNALTARPSASYSGGDGYPEAMNNGNEPKSSSDFSSSKGAANSAWHNWGREGEPAWVMYQWDEPFLASSMDVYVFRDGAGNFQPTDMKLQLRDAEGNWYSPRGVTGLGNALNKYNTTTFEPAYITGARIDMKPLTVGIGILEWKVNGYTGGTDKSQLVQVINFANALKAANFIDQGLAPIADAKANASAVMGNKEATEEDVAQAIQKLLADLRLLSPRDNNMAFAASLSASFTSSWESLPAVNDGLKTAANNPHWGSWGNTSSEEWVQYDWPQGATIQSSNLMLWTDNGGIEAPAKYTYSYIPMNSTTNEWVTAGTITTGITALTTPVGSSNLYEFDPALEVKSLRVTMTKKARNGNGVGLWEWEVSQAAANQNQPAPTTPAGVKPSIFNGNDGKLIGVTSAMEYRKEGAEQYTAITGTEVTGLSAGTYFVRYMQNGSLNASPDKEVVIPEGEVRDAMASISGPSSPVFLGQSIDLPVGVAGLTHDFNMLSVELKYDPAMIEFATSLNDDVNVLDESAITSSRTGLQVLETAVKPETGEILIIMGITETFLNGDGELFVLHGNAKADAAAGTTNVAVTKQEMVGDESHYTLLDTSMAAVDIQVVQADKTTLIASIAAAEELLAAATEGNQEGQYPAGSKAILQAAIDSASLVVQDGAATQTDVVNAFAALDNAVTVFSGSIIHIDKAALNTAITDAEQALSSAVEGSAPGQYPTGTKATLQAAIDAAVLVRDGAAVTQSDVDLAVSTLTTAVSTFRASVNPTTTPSVDLGALNQAIAAAQAKLAKATAGNKIGQYPAAAITNLQAAIVAANNVKSSNGGSQSMVDAAAVALNNAVSTFGSQIVTLVPGAAAITIQDLSILAKYYGVKKDQQGWDIVEKADLFDNHEITILELAAVARMIVGNWLQQ
jgi:Bacterial Ig-like domain (group 4).